MEDAHKGIVSPCMPFANHTHPSKHAALDHQVQRRVGDEVEHHVRVLEHRIPCHLVCAHIVRRVELETPLVHAHISELLEHVGEDGDVDESSWNYNKYAFYVYENLTAECLKI